MKKIISEIWKSLLLALALYGILWAVFRYWIEFTNVQSIALSFLFGACYFRFKELGKKSEQSTDFVPYRVSIRMHNAYDLQI